VIYGPDGAPLCEKLAPDEEGLLYADIDLSAISVAKAAADPAGHYSRPDVTRLLLNSRSAKPVESFALPVDPPREAAPSTGLAASDDRNDAAASRA